MKALRFFSLSIALLCFTLIPARAEDGDNPDQELRDRVIELVTDMNLDHSEVAEITFMINQDMEFIVLKVQTEDPLLESQIKSRLNYKDTLVDTARTHIPYHIRVRIDKV